MDDQLDPEEVLLPGEESVPEMEQPDDAEASATDFAPDGEEQFDGISSGDETSHEEGTSTGQESAASDDASDLHATIVAPSELSPGSTERRRHPQFGFPLPQPKMRGEDPKLDERFDSEATGPRPKVSPESPPVRSTIPSNSITESRQEGVIPRIMITVSLALARDMFDQAVEDAIKRAGLAFHEIAKYEVDQFAFMQKAQQRAADYSLRGPYFT